MATDFRQFVGALAEAEALAAGQLDATRRSHPAVRGDLIYWLGGHELGGQWPTVGAMAQLLSQEVGGHLVAAGLPLLPPREYAAQTMLSVYPARSVGFAAHTDRSGAAGDRRLITAVYYLNPEWTQADGGVLRVSTGESRSTTAAAEEAAIAPDAAAAEVEVEPVLDRLVLFWSDTTTHTVTPTSDGATPRLALSFWFLAADDVHGGLGPSPLEELMEHFPRIN